MDNCESSSFTRLPAELLLMVIEQCGKQDVAALSEVATQYNNICRPIIFKKVDLSIHNRGKVLCTFQTEHKFLFSNWFEPSDSLQCNNIPSSMQKRQEAFLSALITTPSLAQHVRTFSWTLLLLDSNRRTHVRIDPFAIKKSVVIDPKSPFNDIWKVFASLTSVQTLDLAWLSRHLAMPLIHSIPSTLFPAATSVRLVGIMPYALAASVLLANPQALLHLDLDNLQQSGIIPRTHINEEPQMHDEYDWMNGKNDKRSESLSPVILDNRHDNRLDDTDSLKKLFNKIARGRLRRKNTRPVGPILTPILIPPHRQTRQPWNNFDRFRDESKYFNAPGPMQNLLGTVAGKCTSLRSLHLRKVGARDQFDFTPACSGKERDIYAEWAIFLTSVSPTLDSLTFEQGERLLPRADWVQPPVRPMDQLFGDGIFPILMGAGEGRWPRMKRLVVRGVQQWEEDDGLGAGKMVLVDRRADLKGAFGSGVEVVIEKRARVADHLGMAYQ